MFDHNWCDFTFFFLHLTGRPPQRTFGIFKLNKEREPADCVIWICTISFQSKIDKYHLHKH